MQNFYIILSDQNGNIDWKHPNELNGSSKDEIYSLLSQDIPTQNIVEILTAEEYDSKYISGIKKGNNNNNAKQNIADISSDQFENGKDFFNAMLAAGNSIGQENSNKVDNKKKNEKIKEKEKEHNISNNSNISQNNNNQEVRYFEEGGIKFKLENGKLYKKVWKQLLLNGQKTPDGDEAVSEFRLVSFSTKKLVNVDKVELQHLEWEEVKTH